MRSVNGILGTVLGAVALTLAGLLLAIGGFSGGSPTSRNAWANGGTCGNGVVEPPEECDSSSAGCNVGQVCQNDCTCGSAGGAVLRHFQCYEIRPPYSFSARVVSLQDQYGSGTATVSKAKSICAPANKNGEDPDAVADPGHLVNYQIKPAAKFTKRTNVHISNQFGPFAVDVVKPARLLVPSTKSLVGPPPPPSPAGAFPDHFQCYKVKRSAGSPKFVKVTGVSVKTQFEDISIDVTKPLRLCTPVHKNGEDVNNESARLFCYRMKSVDGAPVSMFVNNQFGAQTYLIKQRREFCVPSTEGAYGSPSRAFLERAADLLD